jgi:hypothetical protein
MVLDDGTRLSLGASAARLGASTVAGPARNGTVHRASLSVASTFFGWWAWVAVILVRGDDDVVTLLDTGQTAGLGASGPSVPPVFTVNGAGASVAVALVLEGRANWTAVGRRPGDGAGALLDTTVAWFRALAPSVPGTY